MPSVFTKMFPDNFLNMHSIAVHGGVVSPIFLLFGLIFITLLLYFAYHALDIKTRISHTWSCGYKLSSKTQYTATGFAGPIRRFFSWLYDPDEHFDKKSPKNSHYEVHVKPLFELSIYESIKKFTNTISYWIYRLSHFEKTRYSAMIFNLMLLVLFSYRLFAKDFSWATFLLEMVVMAISIKVLIIGDKR